LDAGGYKFNRGESIMSCRAFILTVLTCILAGRAANADGLIFQLPPDGTWATFTVQTKTGKGAVSDLPDKGKEKAEQKEAARQTGGTETKPERGPDDAKSLQGEWRVVDIERDGKSPPQDPTDMVITFKGDEISGEGVAAAKYKLDPGKSPREIDITYLDGPRKNVTARCIYSVEKDELKLCYPGSNGVRPKELKTKSGDGLLLLVLRRPQSIPAVEIKREWRRPDASPDGNYKLSTVYRAFEATLCLIKLETKNDNQLGSLVDTSSDFAGLKILQSVVSATPPNPAGNARPEGAHIRISFTTPTGDGFFDGDFSFESLEARGSLEMNQQVFPATLSATDLAKLKFTRRELRPPLMYKGLGSAYRGKQPLTEVPKVYEEVFEKYADHPAVFDAAVSMVKDAAKYKISAEQVGGLLAKADKAAASYGRSWRLEFNTEIADAIVAQKAYAAVALEIAARLEKLLLPSDSAETRARVLKAVAVAQGNAGNVAKMEEILDREYRARLPLFKVDSFTGRQAKSDRTVVLELFTGAQCGPCVAADIAFDVLQKTYKPAELVLIQYHLHIPGPDPLTNVDSEARWEYYSKSFPDNIRGVPSTLFNGKSEAGGGGGMEKAEGKYQQFRQIIDPLLETNSGAKLAASAVKQNNKINVAVSVTDLAKPGGNTRLRLLLVEETIRYVGGNKVRFHHQVFRKLVGGPDGFALKDKDNKHTASVDLDELRKSLNDYLDDYNSNKRQFPSSDRPLDLKNLRLIALVQDDVTREILQAAQVEITEAKAGAK
jgi:uncharacterized protein (TIGR03067 family)